MTIHKPRPRASVDATDMGLKDHLDEQYSKIVTAAHSSTNPQETLKSIEVFQAEIKSHIDQLSKFDQERFASNLQKLREQVWIHSKPGRFRFKTKPSPPMTTINTTNSPAHINPSPPSQPELRSVQKIEHAAQSNIHLSDLTRSVVVYSQVQGSVHLENISDSTIIVSSHQCRVHNCRNVEIWLDRCAVPTIENCTGVLFVLPLSCKKVLVNDFSWMQSEVSSPHYSILNSGNCKNWKPFKSLTEEDVKKLAVDPTPTYRSRE